MSIIQDTGLVEELKDSIEKYNSEIISDRGMELDSQVLETILALSENHSLPEITIKSITDAFNANMENPQDKVSSKKMGGIIREKLKLKTERGRKGYFLTEINKERIENLKKKFKTDSTIGCGCLVLIILTALICGIGFILFISHLIQHYRL